MIIKTLIILIFITAGNLYSQKLSPISNVNDVSILMEKHMNKVVLVNFWASWCMPCVSEFPDLVKLYNNYKDQDFVLVTISTDAPEDIETKVKPFLKKNGVKFKSYYVNIEKDEQLYDIMNYFDKNWTGAIPQSYIYDKEGVQKASILGSRNYEDFEKIITSLLN
jgi:thiol-disulfide isomerase/thioredoxin